MDEVICPYCGEKIGIEVCDIAGNEEFITECPNCEKDVEIYAELVLELYAYKPEYFKCKVCGKKEFEIEKRLLPYEQEDGKWEYEKLCDECYWEELKRRRENE